MKTLIFTSCLKNIQLACCQCGKTNNKKVIMFYTLNDYDHMCLPCAQELLQELSELVKQETV